jgi:hypothetical protein
MADVVINKFTTQILREGSTPASPGFVVSEGQDPVNPPGTNNFVPYSGAISNVDLGEFGVDTGFVNLDTTPTDTPTTQGTLYWDDSRSTAALIMNGTLQHIGQDTFFYVKNSTGSTIAKGTAVRFDGTDGASGHLKIAPFLANGTYPSSYFMGVTAEEILNGEFGQVMHFGELDGINTTAYSAGDLLYASTSVAGAFQTTAPVAPNNIVLIAAAINSTNNGAILVRPTYGSNINTDEGVKITSVADKDLLQYQSGTGLWENKTLAQVIGSAYVPSTRTITINGTTQDLSVDRTFNVGTVTSVGLSSATSGVTIGSTPVTTSGTITLEIATASGSQNGLLSSTDWTTFNNKQNALTNPVTGTGTTNYLPKFTGASTIGNSQVFDNGSGVGIGTSSPVSLLNLYGDTNLIQLQNSTTGNTGADGTRINLSGADLQIINRESANMIFYTFDTERMRIFSDGNVFIGSSPSNAGFKLDVNGTGRFSALTTSGNNTFNNSSGRAIDAVSTGVLFAQIGGAHNIIFGDGAVRYFSLFTPSGAATMSIRNFSTSTDFLTFAASTGAATFSSNQNATSTYTIQNTDTTNTSSRLRLDLVGGNSALSFVSIHNDHNYISSVSGKDLYFQQSFGGTTNLTIKSNGNVLIGTSTSGSSKLRLVGLPTSAVGLSSGDVYNSAGVLMIA